MKTILRVASIIMLVILVSTVVAEAQSTTIVREGVADNGQTLHYVQMFQTRGRWIPIDGVYLDFGHPSESREMLIGGGLQVFKSKRFRLIHESYLDQAAGTKNGSGGTSIVTWNRWDTFVTKRVASDIVFFSYWPVAGTAKRHTVVDRARLNFALNSRWLIGGGYQGTKFVAKAWVHKPFANVIFKTKRTGAIETWLQRIPAADGHHFNLQVRWIRSF